MAESRSESRHSWRLMLSCAAIAAALTVGLAIMPARAVAVTAFAPIAPDRAPIVIIDGGLGDVRFYTTHWFGQVQEVAASGAVRLLTSSAPTWWSGAGAPDTYLLTASDASGSVASSAIGTTEIAWALDRVALRHPRGKAVLVAQGAAGLQARAYLEDLGAPKQSARADVVGLVMLGTPNAGLSLMKTYPDLDIWAAYAAGSGLKPDDLAQGSTFLSSLDAGRLPAVVKSLGVEGIAVSFGDRETDGVVLRGESIVATAVALGPIDYVTAKARASESWNLGKSWLPASKKGGASLNVIEDRAVEKLQLARGYVTAPEVRDAVKTFYKAWFAAGAPTTHVSTRLVFDVSGSMAAKWGETTKLDGGRRAVGDFAAAMAARQSLPGAIPEDVGLVVFNENANVAVGGTSDPAVVTAALAAVGAKGNTDVGAALRAAVDSLAQAPRAADKFVVLLSDGVNTAGLDKNGILAGPVAVAKQQGIRVDTIALGGVDASDVGFLTQVAAGTGGTFHQAKDLFELRRDFMRARYSSVGTLGVDTEAILPPAKPVLLGKLGDSVRLLEVAVVPDGPAAVWQVLRDGTLVPSDGIKSVTSPDGVLLLALTMPKAGTYTLKLVDAKGSPRAHVFATTQADAFKVKGSAAPPNSDASLLLIVIAVVGVSALLGVTVAGVRGRKNREGEPTDPDAYLLGAGAADNGDERDGE